MRHFNFLVWHQSAVARVHPIEGRVVRLTGQGCHKNTKRMLNKAQKTTKWKSAGAKSHNGSCSRESERERESDVIKILENKQNLKESVSVCVCGSVCAWVWCD